MFPPLILITNNFINLEIDLSKPVQRQSNLLWTQKYAPSNSLHIIGNQSPIKLIRTWLEDWQKVILHGEKKEIKFNPSRGKYSPKIIIKSY